jgi:hypothetical protein
MLGELAEVYIVLKFAAVEELNPPSPPGVAYSHGIGGDSFVACVCCTQ